MIVQGRINKTQAAAIEYFASQLFTPQLKSHIVITIAFRKNMPVLGYTDVDDYNSKGKPREFVLEINRKQSEKEILKTIAHEMVHCKQYAYGQLNEQGTKWLSRKMDHDSIPYAKRPWEIEAFTVGDKLYKEFACFQIQRKK
jgi:hypothetical protein